MRTWSQGILVESQPVGMNPDGSVELCDALGSITHAKNFMGNKPGLLMAMLWKGTFRDCFRVSIRGRVIQ